MLFSEALKALQEGEYLVREAWSATEYVVQMPGMQYLWKILTSPTPNAGNYLPLVEDMIAADWKLMSEAPSETPVPSAPSA